MTARAGAAPGAPERRGVDHGRDDLLRDAGPGDVVDEHMGEPAARERLEPGADRGVARGAALHGFDVHSNCVVHVVRVDDQQGGVDIGMAAEAVDAEIGYAAPGQRAPLLGQSGAGAGATPAATITAAILIWGSLMAPV